MKKIQILIAILVLGLTDSSSQDVNVIPKPSLLKYGNKEYSIDKGFYIKNNPFSNALDISIIAEQFIAYSDFQLRDEKNKQLVPVYIQHKNDLAEEAYELEFISRKIIIKTKSASGGFYALQSLLQIVSSLPKGKSVLQSFYIKDHPRFKWRGFMLDESRHFFGKNKVKEVLDMMALHKLNKFHWHLTDEPGWRIEIKAYPKLTSVGATGNWHDSKASPQFYSQEDIKEIVAYAKERFIEVIPEIDMPGHASAANRAYPQFSGGGSEKHPDFTFHPAKDSTYAYLTQILKEVAALFPSDYIHIGGDEVHYGNEQWNTDEDITLLMKEHKLLSLKDVESYFINRIQDSLKVLGKNLAGWDEVIDAQLAKEETLVMWWRHDKPEQLDKAKHEGYKVVLCPRIPLYFDFVQSASHSHGRKWGDKFCTLEQVYNFPNKELCGEQVLGVQANVWTERIHNNARFDFMVYPRMSALAEAAWSYDTVKDYDNFKIRLENIILPIYKKESIGYFDELNSDNQSEPISVPKKK